MKPDFVSPEAAALPHSGNMKTPSRALRREGVFELVILNTLEAARLRGPLLHFAFLSPLSYESPPALSSHPWHFNIVGFRRFYYGCNEAIFLCHLLYLLVCLPVFALSRPSNCQSNRAGFGQNDKILEKPGRCAATNWMLSPQLV